MMALMVKLQPTGPLERDVFLMSGQSNGDGQGLLSEVPSFTYADKVKMYRHSGEWTDGSEPMGDESSAVYSVLTADSSSPGASAGMSFGDSLYPLRPGREVGLVPCAIGGNPISSWSRNLSTSTIYGATVARALAAAAAGPLVGFIFYQGEGDADNGTQANSWAANFLTLYDNLASDLSVADLKCIVTELHPDPGGYSHWATVQAQQQSLDGERSGKIVCVSAADLDGKPGDALHIDTASQVILGQRYAAAMATLLAA